MKKLIRNCPICGNEYGKAYKTIKMQLPQDVNLPKEYDVVTCEKCGFAYADVNATQEEYDTYYDQNNVYSMDSILRQRAIVQRDENRVNFIENFIDKKSKILDVGCGSGTLLMALQHIGELELVGLDPSRESICRLEKQGIKGEVKNIFDAVSKELECQFDVVCFTAVLEHIYDLNRCIEQLSLYLKSDGILYIEVPDISGFSEEAKPIPNYFNQEHINYFSRISLDNLLKKHGFINWKSTYIKPDENKGDDVEKIISVLYKRGLRKGDLKKDFISSKAIENYMCVSEKKEKESYKRIQEFVGDENVIIWGTGAQTMQLLANNQALTDKILYFIDGNPLKNGKKLMDRNIFSPEKLLGIRDNYPILICSMRNHNEIVDKLKQLNITNKYMIV